MSLPDPETQPTVDLWPTAGRAAGLSRNATYSAAAKGELPVIKIGSRYRVPTAKLRALLGLDEVTGGDLISVTRSAFPEETCDDCGTQVTGKFSTIDGDDNIVDYRYEPCGHGRSTTLRNNEGQICHTSREAQQEYLRRHPRSTKHSQPAT